MDKCGICDKPAVQLFETGNDGIYACFKCQPLVPEVTIEDSATEPPDPSESQNSNTDEESNDKTYYCGLCHKSFQKTMQLQNHMRNHRAERRFVCTYCNKAFSQSNNLRAHLRIHTNERPFKCNECGKAFTQVTNLNNHVRLHTGERPFVCPEPGCNKAYAQVTNLNQHRKRHLNGRPVESTYDCTICGEQFQQRNHMYTHRREAHPESRGPGQRCGICDAMLPNERLLRLHVAQHALGQPTSEAEHDSKTEEEESERTMTCVFSSCGAVVRSAREHTDHLLSAHQLRVLAAPARHAPAKRGRPPKHEQQELKDPLDLNDFQEIKIMRSTQPQYIPKLKVKSLFQ
ncbi:hypothetical protein ABMA27_008364 [Loxostege sticticalis]|uniref:C2H2-type domain-containing protein n=1 Tax=Loxostege sticticalis TaxID=481309 RepID=A0ABR3HB05_LOXSC